MKKQFRLLLAAVLALILAGCGNTQEQAPANTLTSPPVQSASPVPTRDTPAAPAETDTSGGSVVYMTTDISPEGLMAAYEALGWEPSGRVAVKLSTGEPPASKMPFWSPWARQGSLWLMPWMGRSSIST